jgi:hypothetical protein
MNEAKHARCPEPAPSKIRYAVGHHQYRGARWIGSPEDMISRQRADKITRIAHSRFPAIGTEDFRPALLLVSTREESRQQQGTVVPVATYISE